VYPSAPPPDGGPEAVGPHLEALRIQAAAVVAQQAALDEQELRLREREAGLARQEEQVASRLEDQRRQLLELQDQITEARAALREKRAAHTRLAEEQQRELDSAREEASGLQRSAKAERQRLVDLRHRLVARGRRHWQARRKEVEAREAEVRRQQDLIATNRAALVQRIEKTNAETELGKRRLTESWAQFDRDRQAWFRRRSSEDAAATAQLREVARRMKIVVAAERKAAHEKADLAREAVERRRELEHLESRIGNARLRLLEQKAPLLAAKPSVTDTNQEVDALVSQVSVLGPVHADFDHGLQKRAESLARVAEELSDQRLHLAEQVERLLRTQQEWHAERTGALRDLELFATSFEARELDLDRRSRELHAANVSARSQLQTLAQVRLRFEADRTRAEVGLADRQAEVETRSAELDARERALAAQEDGWRSLLRRWGRRRHTEVLRLRDVQRACWQERAEWVHVRTAWLRLVGKLRDDRRTLAARALAVQQLRADLGGGPAVVKRLERLERQWIMQCENEARYLERLQATAQAEAVRIDETSRRLRQDTVNAEARAALLDNRAAEVEREEQSLEAERLRLAGELDASRAREAAAEARAEGLRAEAERLARLLIDAGPSPALLPSQAA
jgi:hypothetical protein